MYLQISKFSVLIMDDDIREDEETPIPKYETTDLKNLQLSRFTSKETIKLWGILRDTS